MSATGTLVRLRALKPDDTSNWLQWINDPDVMDGLDRAIPVTAEQHAEYIRKNVVQNDAAVWYAIEDAVKGEHIGIVWLWDIHRRHRRAEVRIVISPAHAGHGYGTASLNQVAHYAFNTLGLHKLYAYVHARNAASRRAFESAGFRQEAVLQDEAFSNGAFSEVFRMIRLSDGDARTQ